MNQDKNSLITILVAFLLSLLLSFIPKINHESGVISEKRVESSISTIASTVGDDYKLLSERSLSSEIINIVYKNKNTDDYKSYFIDKNSGQQLTYRSLFKSNTEELFDEVEYRLLSEKYPKFVVDGIKNSNVVRDVYIMNNSLVITYRNVITNPAINEKLTLTINFNEITKMLSFEHDLDEEYQNESGYDYDPTKKYIAFTFDDGPNKNNTNDIVRYLNDNKMRATFFMVGNLMASNPDIVKNVYDNKMEIGSHSWAHKNLKKQKLDVITSEMMQTDNVYKNITGDEIKLMRPPYGAINGTVKDAFNYSYILWNVDTNDWKYKDADHLYDFVLNNVEDGDIVLMHDLQNTTKVGLEKLLPELYARGYRVVTVSELANIKGKTLQAKSIYKSMK